MVAVLGVLVASLVAESALYGTFLVLCFVTAFLRYSRYSASDRPKFSAIAWNPVVLSTAALLVVCTAHWAISVFRFFKSVSRATNAPSTSFLIYLEECAVVAQAVNNFLTLLTIWIGDAVLIYRLWVIWNRNPRIVVFPILLWVGIIIVGCFLTFVFFQPADKFGETFQRYHGWFTANWALTTSVNIYCTGFSAWRIWSACRASGAMAAKPFMSVLVILVESAVFLAAWAIFFVITYQTSSPLEVLIVDVQGVIIGNVNMLIHIRVELASPGFRDSDLGGGSDETSGREVVMTNDVSIFGLDLEAGQGTDSAIEIQLQRIGLPVGGSKVNSGG
ncbi:hypothetical protein MIND_00175000 [Mycena indigotica]|uniref:Uncharacterized protein n=1 Tax=Mycena indigotica TaxID=2126181 RepID=A0A8H6TH01_9AGAR|nr:uncharacterized protein MIND_00175000 [Mycena indigotica]KAF7316557.1 hypothetical protein MIND_00175000 [Mycena indigotica]